MTTRTASEARRALLGSVLASVRTLPLPHEHGAWVMLYVPLIIGLAVGRAALAPYVLIVLAVTGAYLARHAAGLLIRRRGAADTPFWLLVYTGLAVTGGLPLVIEHGRLHLLEIAAIAVALFALHTTLMMLPQRRRMDRSEWGELIGVAALALTAPAGYVTARGLLDRTAWLLWLLCTVYFGSSIFFVKLLLASAKAKARGKSLAALPAPRNNLVYQIGMLGVVLVVGGLRHNWSGLLILIAFVPGIARGLAVAVTPPVRLPSLKRIGIAESVYALWFAGFLIASCIVEQ